MWHIAGRQRNVFDTNNTGESVYTVSDMKEAFRKMTVRRGNILPPEVIFITSERYFCVLQEVTAISVGPNKLASK